MTVLRYSAIALLTAAFASQAAARELVIAVTGETHGALLPCECPLEPDGGLARRAAFIKTLREETAKKGNEFLLIDVGGNAAGGPYDTRPFTRESGLLRSDCVFNAMAGLSYDAVAIGDDELAWGINNLKRWTGKTPFVLQNSPPMNLSPAAEPPFAAAIFVEQNGLTIGITTLTAPLIQPLSEDASSALPVDIQSAKKAAEQLTKAGFRILLSHAGEETSRQIAAEVPGFNLIMNGHSKRTTLPWFIVNNTPIVQFSYETRRVQVVRFNIDANPPALVSVTSERLSDAVGEDTTVATLVKGTIAKLKEAGTGEKTTVTLFTMPFCPYSGPVEKKLLETAGILSEWMTLDIRYLASKGADGKLKSLHGDDELNEARRRTAIRELYPTKFHNYLKRLHEHPEDTWETTARALEIVPSRITGSAETGETDKFLEQDIALARALGVIESPTVFVDNTKLAVDPLAEHALGAVCSGIAKDKQPAICKELPECYTDADCRKPGLEVKCLKPGTRDAKCERTPAKKVPLTIIYPELSLYPVTEKMKNALVEILPGLEVTEYPSQSTEGRSLLAAYPFDALPALLFSSEVREAAGYPDIAGTLKEVAGENQFVVNPAASGANFLHKRVRIEKRVDLFIPLSSKAGREAIQTVLTWESTLSADAPKPAIAFHPVIYKDPKDSQLTAPGGKAALEDALRLIAVSSSFPGKTRVYLKAVADAGGTGYWEEPVTSAGLDPAKVKELSQGTGNHADAQKEAELCEIIAPGGNVTALICNQEVLLPANAGELAEALERSAR